MMMKILEAGGIEILTDNFRTADESNPRGYYEFERVKKLKEGDISWLNEVQDRAVKIVSPLLEYLPDNYNYKIIFMRRYLDEILASQQKMLKTQQINAEPISDEQLKALYQKHLDQIENMLKQHPNMIVTNISYNELLKNPIDNIEKVCQLLQQNLDVEAMLSVIDKNLYRQRKAIDPK